MLNLLAPRCISNRSCNRLCSSRECPYDPVVCIRTDCRCIKNHQNCDNLIYWSALSELYERNQQLNSSQYVNYVHFSLDQLLIQFISLLQQELFRFRQEKMCIGLNDKERQLLKKIKRNQKLTTGLIADVVEGDERFVKVLEYPVSEHQHSVKLIKHMISNLISMFRQAFSFKTVEDEGNNKSFDTNKMLDFSKIQPQSHKKMKESSILALSKQIKNPTTFVNLQDFGSVNQLCLKACSSKQLKLASQLFLQLDKLDIQDCGLNLQGVRALKGFKKVQHLNIHKNTIGDDALVELSKQLPQLRALGLRNTGISDRGLISMSFNLKNLNQLYISDNSKIKREGIEALGKNCFNIHTLFLCNNNLSDDVICTLLNDLLHVQVLSLKNNNIHDQTINVLTAKFPRLFAIYAAENKLTDLSCEYLARLQNIQTLFLCNNFISQKGVDLLLKSLESLQWLGLRNNKIGEEKKKEYVKYEKCKIIV